MGSPPDAIGNVGDFYMDAAKNGFYGPKTDSGWGVPIYLVTSIPGVTTQQVVASGDTTLTGENDLVVVVTGSYRVTLPASPAVGQTITLVSHYGGTTLYTNGVPVWTGAAATAPGSGVPWTDRFMMVFDGTYWHTLI